MIEKLTLINRKNQKISRAQLRGWKDRVSGSDVFGPVKEYRWAVGGNDYSLVNENNSFALDILPDNSGFIKFENSWEPNNCTLLDEFGKNRLNLSVPWEMTGTTDFSSGQSPTCFISVSSPYVNPNNGARGEYGVIAWIEFEGKYYFELNYKSGDFLWCRKISD